MKLYTKDSLTVFWGTKDESIVPDEWRGRYSTEIMDKGPFTLCAQTMGIKQFVTVRQKHGIEGIVVHDVKQCLAMQLFSNTADYLVTQEKGIGLVVATADCLPLVIYDPLTCSVALVHAGWRGSVDKIAKKAVEALCTKYGCAPKDLEVFLGPSARVCCYEVDALFVKALECDEHIQSALEKREEKWYFNIPLYTTLVLESVGVVHHKIHFENNICTLCCIDYCSHRRNPESERRNITVVSLK